MTKSLYIVALFACLNSNGQTQMEAFAALEKINTSEEFESFENEYRSWEIKMDEVYPGPFASKSNWLNHDESVLYETPIGESALFKPCADCFLFAIKVLKRYKLPAWTVKYIFLDGNKLLSTEIEELRDNIIDQYKSGVSFDTLAVKYSMDGSNGEKYKFIEGMTVSDFEDNVKEHNNGEIFKVDVYSNRWYYVVLKIDDKDSMNVTQYVSIKLR